MSMIGIGAAELLVIAVMLLGGGVGGIPLGGTPLPPDPGLQSVAPAECLFFAAHYGLGEADPKSTNRFEQLLAESENQAFFGELNRLAEALLKQAPQPDEPTRLLCTTAPTLVRTLLTRPSVLYVGGLTVPPNAPSGNAAWVIHAGDRLAALRDAVEQWEKFYLSQVPANQAVEVVKIEGVETRRLPLPPGAPPVVWGVMGEYLFLAAGEGEAAGVIARLRDRPAPAAWLTQLKQEAKLPRLGALMYLDLKGVMRLADPFVQLAPQFGIPFDVEKLVESLGLRQLRYLAVASGLDDETAVGKLLLGHDPDAPGIASLLHAPPLTKADLAEIPRQVDFAVAARVDGDKIFRQIIDHLTAVDPNSAQAVNAALGEAEEQIGFGIRGDLLAGLGDVGTLYNSSAEGGSLFTGLCATISVRDRAKVERVIEQLLRIAAAETRRGDDRPPFEVRKLTVGERAVSYVQFLDAPIPVAPAWCVTDERLIVGLSPQMVRVHLSRPADAGSLADEPAVARQLAAGDVVALSYADTTFGSQVIYSYVQYGATMGASALEKETGIRADLGKFPSFTAIRRHLQPSVAVVRSSATVWSAESYATGPNPIPIAGTGLGMALVLPQIQAARETARQNTAMNHLRSLAVAANAYENDHGKPLPRAILSADGKPLLSWRVALLPYLDQQALYEQFKLNEPWDSDHNRKLIAAMPPIYVHPSLPELRELGATAFQIPTGAGTLYGEKFVRGKIPDGVVPVLFVVSSPGEAVIWSQPQDVEIDPESPFTTLAPRGPPTIPVVMLDGSAWRVTAYGDSPVEADFIKRLLPNK